MAQQTMQRSPQPYNVEHGSYGYVIDHDGEIVAICESDEPRSIGAVNAAFIVQACNAHDDLVAALRQSYEAMLLADWNVPHIAKERKHAAFMAVRAALAKAGAAP